MAEFDKYFYSVTYQALQKIKKQYCTVRFDLSGWKETIKEEMPMFSGMNIYKKTGMKYVHTYVLTFNFSLRL